MHCNKTSIKKNLQVKNLRGNSSYLAGESSLKNIIFIKIIMYFILTLEHLRNT